jgi:translation elongation factor aEF-1 beta
MAVVSVIAKILPESPSENLEAIESYAKSAMEKEGAKNVSFEIQEVAFGLKAVMIKMAMPEEKGTDLIESALSKIKGVSSVQIVDYRRAFG